MKQAIRICLTIGELSDALKNFETYGLFLRGSDPATGKVEDEPEKELETVLSLTLTVQSDLDPAWTLISDRATAQSVTRNLTWADRVELSPTRIGALAESNLGWRRGSVLNRLTDEKADASAAIVKAARDARDTFGDGAAPQLVETLRIVGEVAKDLGIDVGEKVRAPLDAHAATFAGGTVSLHNQHGVPLRGLGIGSTRLLIAGLQQKAAAQSSVVLVDELEHGLEPHRIIRFLPDHELQFGNEVDDQLAVRAQRFAQRVSPSAKLRLALAEKGPDKAPKSLGQGGVGDVALVLVELTRREEAARRDKRPLEFVHHRRLADAGIAGDEHELGCAIRHDPVEGAKQRLDLVLPAVQLLRRHETV